MGTELIGAGGVLLLVTIMALAGWCGLRAACRGEEQRQTPEVIW
jgi:hypothetical protein